MINDHDWYTPEGYGWGIIVADEYRPKMEPQQLSPLSLYYSPPASATRTVMNYPYFTFIYPTYKNVRVMAPSMDDEFLKTS